MFDAALDALSSIVSHPDTHSYPNLSKDLLRRILNLQPILVQLMNEGSYDIATPLASLFVSFGEVGVEIVTSRIISRRIIDVLMRS